MTTVVLVHGWGYDAGLWETVRARLSPALPVVALDLGFFGAASPAPSIQEPVIAVGHSLGALWWLARTDIPWRRLLCLNGFPRFTAAADYAPAVAPRVLDRMRTRFAHDPAAVLADFRARCGGHAPAGVPDAARLAAGLGQLADGDGRAALAARAGDVFALAASDDPIVPAAMSAAAFAGLPPGHFALVPARGHLLPRTDPDPCARWIARLAE